MYGPLSTVRSNVLLDAIAIADCEMSVDERVFICEQWVGAVLNHLAQSGRVDIITWERMR